MGIIKICDLTKEIIKQIEVHDQEIKYLGYPLYLQSEWGKFSYYGIPREDQYHKSDKDRSYFKVPLEKDDALIKNLITLDAYFLSTLNKDLEYHPIVSIPNNDDYPPYIKIHFNKQSKFVTLDNKNKRVAIEYNSIDSLKDQIKFKSDFRFIFHVAKVWNFENRCGIKLQLYAMEIATKKWKPHPRS